jgi:hypothetical protein
MKDLEKEFVPYQPSLDMKELGFDEPCFGLWNINNGKYEADIIGICKYSKDFKYRELLAPTFSQCFKWFREKQEIEGFVHKSIEGNYYFVIKRIGNNESNMYEFTKTSPKTFDTYEEAELECLKKLIEIVKNK